MPLLQTRDNISLLLWVLLNFLTPFCHGEAQTNNPLNEAVCEEQPFWSVCESNDKDVTQAKSLHRQLTEQTKLDFEVERIKARKSISQPISQEKYYEEYW